MIRSDLSDLLPCHNLNTHQSHHTSSMPATTPAGYTYHTLVDCATRVIPELTKGTFRYKSRYRHLHSTFARRWTWAFANTVQPDQRQQGKASPLVSSIWSCKATASSLLASLLYLTTSLPHDPNSHSLLTTQQQSSEERGNAYTARKVWGSYRAAAY